MSEAGIRVGGPVEVATYRGPVCVEAFDVAGREIRIVRPSDPDRLLDDPDVHAQNRRDDYMPYWAYVWPGSILLARAMVERWAGEVDADVEVLELGCGLGMGGLAAMSLGFRACFSDYDPAAFPFVDRSIVENGFDLSMRRSVVIDWREPPPTRFARIVASDVLYERRLVPLVAEVLSQLLGPGGQALLATPYRVAAEGFPQAARARGLIVSAEPVVASPSDLPPGTIFRVDAPAVG